jgi:hypothetical protein
MLASFLLPAPVDIPALALRLEAFKKKTSTSVTRSFGGTGPLFGSKLIAHWYILAVEHPGIISAKPNPLRSRHKPAHHLWRPRPHEPQHDAHDLSIEPSHKRPRPQSLVESHGKSHALVPDLATAFILRPVVRGQLRREPIQT